MVFIKHNSLKSDIYFNPLSTPCFSGSRLFRVQVFQGRSFQGPGFSGSGSRFRVQTLEVAQLLMFSMFYNILRLQKHCEIWNTSGFFWRTLYDLIVRSCHSEVCCKKGAPKNSSKCTGKHQCQGRLLNKVAGTACGDSETAVHTFSNE